MSTPDQYSQFCDIATDMLSAARNFDIAKVELLENTCINLLAKAPSSLSEPLCVDAKAVKVKLLRQIIKTDQLIIDALCRKSVLVCDFGQY